MYILGIESSCDETSAAVVKMTDTERTICSNIVASQIETHRLYGGVVPEIASRAHIESISAITYEALEKAGIGICDVKAVGVTAKPGLIGALLVGVNFAKSLAYANKIPLIAVNHIHGHVCAALLAHPQLKPPFLALVVSGGHTSIYKVNSYTEYEEIGATRDDAVGESFDKVGRVIGLPYPAGAALDKLAHNGDPRAIEFPSPAIIGDNLDFSFSGIKTAALNYINNIEQKEEKINCEDLAASYTRAVTRAISKKIELALDKTQMKTLVMAGGVAANSHLREAVSELCRKRNAEFLYPPVSLCGDNAAMIAAAAYYEFLNGNLADTSLNASACE